jgi:hypothetical protein
MGPDSDLLSLVELGAPAHLIRAASIADLKQRDSSTKVQRPCGLHSVYSAKWLCTSSSGLIGTMSCCMGMSGEVRHGQRILRDLDC